MKDTPILITDVEVDVLHDIFLKKNCGGVSHSASRFFYIKKKEKTVQERLIEVHQGARKERRKIRNSKQLNLSIVQFVHEEKSSLSQDEDAPVS